MALSAGKSTKLVHGGVRYLEKAVWQLDVSQLKLVYEALHVRGKLPAEFCINILSSPHGNMRRPDADGSQPGGRTVSLQPVFSRGFFNAGSSC